MVIGHHYELFYAIYLPTWDLFPSPFTPITLTSSYLFYLTLRGYSSISTPVLSTLSYFVLSARRTTQCFAVRVSY
jgi:hypothetical protein